MTEQLTTAVGKYRAWEAAAKAERDAAERRDAALQAAVRAGVSLSDLGREIGISRQRVYAITKKDGGK